MRSRLPRRFVEAGTRSYCARAHFLLVRIDGGRAEVSPIGEDGRPLPVVGVGGEARPGTSVVEAGA